MPHHHPGQLQLLTEWRSQLAAIVHRKPWLTGLLLGRSRRLLRRFAHFYHRLQALSRRRRRLLRRKLGTSLAGAALLLALSGAPTQANSITVAAGVVRIDPFDGRCSLIEALENADDSSTGQLHLDCEAGNPTGADTINLPAGSLFTLTATNNSTYGPTGLPVISSDITIEGNGATINRNSPLNFRILTINDSGRLTLNEVTISGGVGENGGGIFNSEGRLVAANSTISANEADDGGGIFNNLSVTILTNSVVTGNEANKGGGIYNLISSLALTNSTVSGNQVSSKGGGIFNDRGILNITHSTISGNMASDGGGLYTTEEKATITHSTISGNQANNGGGGLANDTGTISIINSTISGNQAPRGGGLFNGGETTLTGTLTVAGSTISGNQAEDKGGGMFNDQYSVTRLAHSLISGNSASEGAEIYNKITITSTGSIVANRHNLLGHAGLSNAEAFESFTPGPTDIDATNTGQNFPLANILHTTLADNGGDTQTHALDRGSPALDAVPNSSCATAPIDGIDQRGQPRNTDGDFQGDSGTECDIGAFELQTSFLTLIKKLAGGNPLEQDFLFETPAGPITLTTNTEADTESRDLPAQTHTIREAPQPSVRLLSVTCVDDEGQDVTGEVVDDFSSADLKADITLAKEDDLTCTFLNEENRLFLPVILKR